MGGWRPAVSHGLSLRRALLFLEDFLSILVGSFLFEGFFHSRRQVTRVSLLLYLLQLLLVLYLLLNLILLIRAMRCNYTGTRDTGGRSGIQAEVQELLHISRLGTLLQGSLGEDLIRILRFIRFYCLSFVGIRGIKMLPPWEGVGFSHLTTKYQGCRCPDRFNNITWSDAERNVPSSSDFRT